MKRDLRLHRWYQEPRCRVALILHKLASRPDVPPQDRQLAPERQRWRGYDRPKTLRMVDGLDTASLQTALDWMFNSR